MSSLKNFALPLVALAGVAAFWLWRGSLAPPAATPVAAAGPARAPATHAAESTRPSTTAAATAASPEASRSTPSVEPPSATRRDRAATNAMREQLRTLSRGSTSSRREAEASDDEPAPGTLDKAYIQSRVREDLLPIAKECYESALEDDPKLAGKLVMKFSIVGDPSVGGVVDEAQVDPSSAITHPDLLECMRESMLSLSFPPPEGGGKVDVTYPFEFAPDDAQPGSK